MSSEEKGRISLLVIFKEITTAALGLVIVFATLVLLWPSLTASPIDVTSAQGVFSILGGWGGVVLGYYFGRMPAERAAARAEEAVAVARKEKDVAEKGKSKSLAASTMRLADAEKKLERYAAALETVEKYLAEIAEGE